MTVEGAITGTNNYCTGGVAGRVEGGTVTGCRWVHYTGGAANGIGDDGSGNGSDDGAMPY